jgi:ankyrin repeat protein
MCNVAGETALHLASAAKNSSVIFEIFKRGATVTAHSRLFSPTFFLLFMVEAEK